MAADLCVRIEAGLRRRSAPPVCSSCRRDVRSAKMNAGELQVAELGRATRGDGTDAALKVLIADDHPLLLAGLRRTLETESDIEIVGQARSVPELLGLIERRQPRLVLTDLRMPGGDGFELIARVRDSWPEIKLVVLSASDDQASVDGALRAGASAFIVKSTASLDVASVLRQVSCGAVFHAPARTPRKRPVASRGGRERADPHPTRTADLGRRRPGQHDRRDQPRPVGLRAHGQVPPHQYLPEARGRKSERSSSLRVRTWPRRMS